MQFDEYYRQVVGERWDELKKHLTRDAKQIARYTRFALSHGVQPEGLFSGFENCFEQDREPTCHSGRLDFYRMDLASVLAARALDVQPHEKVLDLCAAPGGKTLILAEALGEEGSLTANDLSQARLSRLRRVLKEYLPETVLEQIRVTHHDASRWGLFEPESYDKILLDAPCSGERHLLHAPEELKTWSKARSKHLSSRQYALLCSAVDSTRPGGRVVYSTCSVSPLENDDVIAKLLKKRQAQVEVLPIPGHVGEHTKYGWQVWPDQAGFGPIYYCALQKK